MSDLDSFLMDLQISGRDKHTIDDYRVVVGGLFQNANKTCAADLTVDDVRKYILSFQKRVGKNTFFIYVANVKAFLKRYNAPLYVWMLNNVKPKMVGVDTIPMSKEQLYALATEFKRHCHPAWMADLWEAVHWFIAAIGCRIGETCKLNMGDVSEVDGNFKIYFKAENTKLKKARTVYLARASYAGSIVYNYIRKYRANAKDDEPLFLNRDGCRLGRWGVERKYRSTRKKLGIKTRCTPHVLRHTYVTFMRHNKVPLEQVCAMTGHSKQTLLNIYSHVNEEDKVQLAKKYQIV